MDSKSVTEAAQRFPSILFLMTRFRRLGSETRGAVKQYYASFHLIPVLPTGAAGAEAPLVAVFQERWIVLSEPCIALVEGVHRMKPRLLALRQCSQNCAEVSTTTKHLIVRVFPHDRGVGNAGRRLLNRPDATANFRAVAISSGKK